MLPEVAPRRMMCTRERPPHGLVRMKTLIALSVLQTIGIAALVVHVLREEPDAASGARPASPPAAEVLPHAAPGVGEERLRTIVREELARVRDLPAASGDTEPQVPAVHRNPSADLRRREAVAQQIENYRAVGAITDAQMEELQSDIAQLDEASRKQMMSRLIRALNSGDIKGRL